VPGDVLESIQAHWVRVVIGGVLLIGVVLGLGGLAVWSSHTPDETTLLTTSEVDWAISLIGVYGLFITVVALVIALREARLLTTPALTARRRLLREAQRRVLARS
jgi:hypothetical protein